MGLNIPLNRLRPFDGTLVGFLREQVEVRGHLKLRTIFLDRTTTNTILIRYIVVENPSSYKLLLGRIHLQHGGPLNKIRVVVSTPHLKMKFPS